MNKKYKEKWIDALESGEYKQIKGRLRSSYGYCCLGVLCDVVKDEIGFGWTTHPYLAEVFSSSDGLVQVDGLPPQEVLDLVGLFPYAEHDQGIPITYNGQPASLARANDEFSLTFTEIAQIIREQL